MCCIFHLYSKNKKCIKFGKHGKTFFKKPKKLPSSLFSVLFSHGEINNLMAQLIYIMTTIFHIVDLPKQAFHSSVSACFVHTHSFP